MMRQTARRITPPAVLANTFEEYKKSFVNLNNENVKPGSSERYLAPQKRLRFDGVEILK